ncbi:hypothetical protein [Coralloluteibacterium stylophorae]|uniref:Uncharacterized protein n=1 Tax=Coralloluteibacterium stylophorae TaxID=1776034 RepID=A0A8J8AXU4_9GAMM|nr:hypothetical protein [Coralloluteibacterium stylophorae]MBS7456262.1 hypothetical protein [Coralloluteibacterium stylophorae]
MTDLVPIFRLRPPRGCSVGPDQLRGLWSDACGCLDVSVGRCVALDGFDARDGYLLHGGAELAHRPEVETRLRALLDRAHLLGTLTRIA